MKRTGEATVTCITCLLCRSNSKAAGNLPHSPVYLSKRFLEMFCACPTAQDVGAPRARARGSRRTVVIRQGSPRWLCGVRVTSTGEKLVDTAKVFCTSKYLTSLRDGGDGGRKDRSGDIYEWRHRRWSWRGEK